MKANTVHPTDEDILSEIRPYYTYAAELRKVAPVISYSCEWLGTSIGMQKVQIAK